MRSDDRFPSATRWALALAGLGVVALAGCRDELTSPVDCPALCPGGQTQVQELVLPGLPRADTSFAGYISPGLGISLRISDQLPASEDRAITVFLPRQDSILISDTLRGYTIDSVIIGLTLQARDTLIDGLKFFLYRLPTDLDTSTTFADVEPNLVPANLIDSIVVPDSQKTGLLRTVLSGVDLPKVAIPAADSGRLAIGLRISAAAPTGVRIASIAASGAPNVTTHVHANIADTSKQRQAISRFPQFTTFVSQTSPPVGDSLHLPVGGAPSSRALLRFSLPQAIRDSVTILRATLELTPDTPILGLPNDPAFLQAFGVIGDFGAKSPIISTGNTIGRTELLIGTSGTVAVDITRLVRLWQTSEGLPQVVFLAVAPEAASFTRPVFRSLLAVGGPQIRITYFQQFPFERP